MAKRPSAPPQKESRPAPSRSNPPGGWRRGQRQSWGSFWNLLWRRGADDESSSPRKMDPQRRIYAFRVRLAGAVMTVAILITALIVWVLIPHPAQTPLVAVAVTDYAFPIPPNAYAIEDLQGFYSFGYAEGQVATRTDVRWVGKAPAERVRGKKIVEQLRDALGDPNCRPGGPDKNVILVYVSAHGVVNGDGEACLLEADSQPLDSQDWVPLKTLLSVLSGHPKWGADSKVHTVLFLDCSRASDDWQLGQLYNSFAARLEQEMKGVTHPRLTIVSSAGPGQVGWSAPALGGSVFG